MQAIKAKQECPAKIKNTEYALSRLGSVRAGCLNLQKTYVTGL